MGQIRPVHPVDLTVRRHQRLDHSIPGAEHDPNTGRASLQHRALADRGEEQKRQQQGKADGPLPAARAKGQIKAGTAVDHAKVSLVSRPE